MKSMVRREKAAVDIVQMVSMPNGGSDITLKKNVMKIGSGLSKVLALRPVTWNWKSDKNNDPVKHGFIAQEVEEILPDLVQPGVWRDGTTRKFLATNDLVPYLVLAIQEQQEQISELTRQLNKK